MKLCSLRFLKVYLNRRDEIFCRGKDDFLWLRKVEGLSQDLRKIIKESRRWSNDLLSVIYFPHQLEKFAVSYICKYFHKPEGEESFPKNVGNVSWYTLKDNYLGEVPSLRCICVLPLGTVDPAKL